VPQMVSIKEVEGGRVLVLPCLMLVMVAGWELIIQE
jgi:hypothetical protein